MASDFCGTLAESPCISIKSHDGNYGYGADDHATIPIKEAVGANFFIQFTHDYYTSMS